VEALGQTPSMFIPIQSTSVPSCTLEPNRDLRAVGFNLKPFPYIQVQLFWTIVQPFSELNRPTVVVQPTSHNHD
jgi:hypothetical protein